LKYCIFIYADLNIRAVKVSVMNHRQNVDNWIMR
jgi:hypothetical protein